jgi:SAM-dependent methyltransferase
MISPRLIEISQCPDCGRHLLAAGAAYRCEGCGREFDAGKGYLDLRPREAFQEQTKYLDEALHADARHESIAPPLLGSKIRNDMLRRFLRPAPGDRILDLGCGSGRTLAWNAASGAQLTGIDIAPYFAHETIETHDLLLGDLRRLPIRDASFGKAWSLDVLEHLSRPALVAMLSEANRVLAADGALFVYTHVRKNGWIAGGTRLVNRFAAFCERLGLLDLKQERLRKSDHVNPLTDHDDLARVAAECGFRIERITYYTPIIGAFVENVVVRIAEKWLTRRELARTERAEASEAARRPASAEATAVRRSLGEGGSPSDQAEAVRAARRSAQARVGRGGFLFAALTVVSWIMALDVILFGRLRSGPFFALFRKSDQRPSPDARR